MTFPAKIVGKRTRVKLDGKRIRKIHLDKAQQTNVEHKVDTFVQVYRKLTGKDVVFEFPEPIFVFVDIINYYYGGWNDREYSITDLLMKDFGKGPFRPEFRGADLIDLAERFIEDARVTLHPHPYLEDEGRRAIHVNGENDKSECLACYGEHYKCDCPVIATAEMRRRLFEARRECILCRRQHAEGQKGHYQNIRECGDPECTDLPKHHRMTCSNYAIDKSRQSKIDHIEFGN